ncbi:DNA-binding protein [Methylomonas sp. YC3]
MTEEEVHTACTEIAAQGERPTALKLLDNLGRGSLTTITKYLNSWYASDEAQTLSADTLPAVIQLPQELTKDGEDLLKKIWNIAKGIADKDLEVQREALRQAEKDAQARVEEAFAFSEAQAMKIERLEEDFRSIKGQLDAEHVAHVTTKSLLAETEKANVGLSKDREQLEHEVEELKKQVGYLEATHKAALADRQQLEKDHVAELKQKDAEIRTIDIQVGKLQSSLDAITKSYDDLKVEVQRKNSELSKQLTALENLRGKYESEQTELKSLKSELQASKKVALDAEKLVANLEGRLSVYKSLDVSVKNGDDSPAE